MGERDNEAQVTVDEDKTQSDAEIEYKILEKMDDFNWATAY